jgi:hypothetical protein
MLPPLFGCRTNSELCRVRGWDKHLPSHLLSALPKCSWLKRLRRLALEVLVPLWRDTASVSEATRSRWQWTWVGDDSVFKKYGEPGYPACCMALVEALSRRRRPMSTHASATCTR